MFHPPTKEVIHIENVSEYGGLQLFNFFWKNHELDPIFNKARPKKSGPDYSNVMKNVTLGHIIGYTSLEDLTDKTFKEELLKANCQVSRTTYSRNMGYLNHNKQNTLLLNLMLYVISNLKFSQKTMSRAIGILDASPIEVQGETFENAQWVHDGRIDGLVWGYEIMTLVIQIGKYTLPFQFRVNDFTKQGILLMVERMRKYFGIKNLCFDAGIRGMSFYATLDKAGYTFCTKATMNWHWDFNCFDKQTTDLVEIAKYKFFRNYKYVDLIVEKKIDDGPYKGETMKLRMVFVKGDKRVFLTNDFDSSPKQIYEFYFKRWKIEESFREEKENLGFEKLTVRKINAIRSHIMTVFIAYIFCQLCIAKFRGIKGIKILIRKVFYNTVRIINIGKNIIIRFIRSFALRKRIEYVLNLWDKYTNPYVIFRTFIY